jgi:hypothetical protein
MTESEVYVIFTKEVTEEQKQRTIEFYESQGMKVMIGTPPPKRP